MKIIQIKRGASGTILPVSERVFLPRSEFHCRYPSLFEMNDSVRWSTYHRSDFKKIEGTTKDQFKFQGNQDSIKTGMYPKTGNFYNPFHFQSYKKALKPVKKATITSEPALWYDRLLEQQKKMAAYVVAQVKTKDPDFLINADNNYTCVLFSLPKPVREKNPKIWSEFLSVYLIALANTLAYERGINIEMVHRSSFGCLRPSVAECGESVRVNLGLTPKPYADCVIDAIIYLQKIVKNSKAFKIPFKSVALTNTLNNYNEKKSTKTKPVNICLKDTLWDTLWAPGDSSNKSFASQMFRKSVVKECLVDLIQNACLEKPLDDLFKDTKAFDKAFVEPVKKVLQSIKLNGQSLSVQLDSEDLKSYEWAKAQKVVDDEFWTLAEEMAERLGVTKREIKTLVSKKVTEDFHSCFEAWVANFIFQPGRDNSVKDGNGSDSEDEGELEIKGKPQTVHAKKLITATGMRAIQLIHAVSRKYLHDKYKIDPLYLTFSASQMYYETDEALAAHPIPIDYSHDQNKKRVQTNVGFFDVNHCNTTHDEMEDEIALIDKKDRICAIDVTSATTQEIHETLVRLYERRPNLELILTISSGLKNEQAMGDYNPYGTIRIFSKDRESLDTIYDDLVQLEEQAGYLHPKESHLIRKTAKLAGMTPTNASILS
ncbi:hypothetical protein [Legionella bononiensis]|uniref:Coiled-coil-containing protein n=1 Tax=Legionella bononiensis TaxID=2793102 RepID=A0ABS1W866_9GAMM|nr:hypothetical protein [Legionella bononiensis]MBL7479927.1 hypothetical protein [Legionella bononiensis]MBL7525558.1 hypothetical protein [Legionella bononiensis]MBL7561742.1 hypothetical protein [Legionella bononiensis]